MKQNIRKLDLEQFRESIEPLCDHQPAELRRAANALRALGSTYWSFGEAVDLMLDKAEHNDKNAERTSKNQSSA